jgi:hypothetical protein
MDGYRLIAIVLLPLAWCLTATAPLRAEDAAEIAEYQPGTPFTYLFDTGSRSPRPLSPNFLAVKHGWTVIPEDETEHEFQGDAVLANDKLTVVLRAQGPGAEVYSRAAGGPRFRAVVMSAPRKALAVTGISALRIVENSLGAVMVEADLRGDGQSGRCTAAFRLTTGRAMLEMTGLEAADRFFVWSVTRYVVVPDFFADDMVFSAATCDLNRFGLPAENFLLNLLDGGDAMLTCVWRSLNRDAYAVLTGEGPERRIRGCEFAGGEDETLWVAVLEQPDIWGSLVFADERLLTGWQPRFDAAWRLDLVADEPFTRSANLSKTQIEARVSREPEPPESTAEGKDLELPSRSEAERFQGIVYALDRDAATPLTTFCPIDVLRNTLGVGPCQYVLQTEGLASAGDPTPANVMDWVEKQFEKGEEAESADQICQRIDQMIAHMEHVQHRIDEYRALSREIRELCVAQRGNGRVQAAAWTFSVIIGELRQSTLASADGQLPSRAAELAEQIVKLSGKDNALEECRRLADEVRRVGALQDRMLSTCRMLLRWLNQQARMWPIRRPESAEFAGEVRRRVERFLAEKQQSADR